MDRYGEEGLPWILLAVREVTQESTGLSSNNTVSDPLNLQYAQWKDADPSENLFDYVNCFCHRLYAARALAKKKYTVFAQGKMKTLYDRRAEQCVFSEGDQVLAFLPITNSLFQAKYTVK